MTESPRMHATWSVLFVLAGCMIEQPVRADDSATAQAALAAVARRIDAFNAHDTEAYLRAHHADVQIYEYPDRKVGEGRSHLERIFGPMLHAGVGRVVVNEQFVLANTVVSDETLTLGGAPTHVIVIYTVEDDLIVAYRLIEPE